MRACSLFLHVVVVLVQSPRPHLTETSVCGTVCLCSFWTPHTQNAVSNLIHTRLLIARLLSISVCGKFKALAFIEAQGLQCTSTESYHNHLHLFEALQLPPIGRSAFPSLPHHNILEWGVIIKGEFYFEFPHSTFILNFLKLNKFSVKVHLKCVWLIHKSRLTVVQQCQVSFNANSKRNSRRLKTTADLFVREDMEKDEPLNTENSERLRAVEEGQN